MEAGKEVCLSLSIKLCVMLSADLVSHIMWSTQEYKFLNSNVGINEPYSNSPLNILAVWNVYQFKRAWFVQLPTLFLYLWTHNYWGLVWAECFPWSCADILSFHLYLYSETLSSTENIPNSTLNIFFSLLNTKTRYYQKSSWNLLKKKPYTYKKITINLIFFNHTLH